MVSAQKIMKDLCLLLDDASLAGDLGSAFENMAARCKGQINRSALHSLVSRAGIRHQSRGKPLRKSMQAIYDSISKLNLGQYVPGSLMSEAADILKIDARADMKEERADDGQGAGATKRGGKSTKRRQKRAEEADEDEDEDASSAAAAPVASAQGRKRKRSAA